MIIAEIGQNFLGSIPLAKKLIELAQENGADLCKFQLYDHNVLYKDYPEIQNCELTKEQAFELFNYGKNAEMEVFFSVFDVERVKWCEEMGVKRYKIAYSQWTNSLLWREIEQTRKPIVCSMNFIPCYPVWAVKLYCVPHYPAQIKEYEFKNLSSYDGISDHTIGLDAAKIALARGAQIIEKHFTLCYNVGIDGAWSMTPSDLKELKRWEQICQQCL